MPHQDNQLSEEESIFLEFLIEDLASDNYLQRNFDEELLDAEMNREIFTKMTENANRALEKIIQVAAHPQCEAPAAIYPLFRTLITQLTEIARKCETVKQHMEDMSIQALNNCLVVELEHQVQNSEN